MKKIFRIARLELGLMFYSPIAWLVLIIFIIQTGTTFTDMLYRMETNQQLGRALNVMSKVLFAGEDGILATIQQNLYLYIPLLTMGLFSRETSSGSIKLLWSSPVTVPQIVLGKFLSMMVYSLILAGVLASFIITGIISIEALDIKFVLGGIFGIYLLMCAYSAIGIFMSSLTSYQVVAAVSTLAVLAGLNFIGGVGQAHDFVRDITYWISISGRADNFVNGLVSTKDVLYFLLVTGLFLTLTILRFNNERQTLSKGMKLARYSAAVFSVVLLGYLTSLPHFNFYHDTTRFKDRTLTENSQNIVGELKEPLKLTTYVNAVHYSASYGSPLNRISDEGRFEMYRRFLPDMEMDYVVYYDTLAHYNDTTQTLLEKAKTAASVHKFDFNQMLSPEQIKEEVDLIPENNRMVRFVNYGGKQTPLRMFDDIHVYPNEAEISAALKRLLHGPGRVGVLTGNNERSIHTSTNAAYSIITRGVNIRGSLINQGFDVFDVEGAELAGITDSLDVLVLADPKRGYSEAQLEQIMAYIDSGGNIMIAGEPGRQEYLNPILEKLGLAFAPGTLLQESEDFEVSLIQGVFTPDGAANGYSFYEKAVVTMPEATGIVQVDSTDFRVIPILATNGVDTWNKTEEFDLGIEKVAFDPDSDQKIAAPLALALEREINDGTQKIMVLGDADFLSNGEMNRNNINNVNSSFAIRMFRWFSDGEYPVSTGRPKAIDVVIKLDRTEIQWLKGIYLGLLPVTIGGFGMLILIRRKRK